MTKPRLTVYIDEHGRTTQTSTRRRQPEPEAARAQPGRGVEAQVEEVAHHREDEEKDEQGDKGAEEAQAPAEIGRDADDGGEVIHMRGRWSAVMTTGEVMVRWNNGDVTTW